MPAFIMQVILFHWRQPAQLCHFNQRLHLPAPAYSRLFGYCWPPNQQSPAGGG
jgi:hypothetical protein